MATTAFWDKSKAADTVVCGGGFDQVNGVRASGHIDACEQTVTCCNWAHFAGAPQEAGSLLAALKVNAVRAHERGDVTPIVLRRR